MRALKPISLQTTDALLKSILILARTVDTLLEGRPFTSDSGTLSASKVQMLRLLHQRGPQNATQIARFLGVSKPAITQIADGMVRDGLIRRQRTDRDRRGVELSVTPKGRRAARSVRDEQRHLVRSAMRHLGSRKADEWTQTLQAVAGTLARADRAFQRFCLQCGAHADGSCVLVGGDAACPFLCPDTGTPGPAPAGRGRPAASARRGRRDGRDHR